jgi:hypothetical protein
MWHGPGSPGRRGALIAPFILTNGSRLAPSRRSPAARQRARSRSARPARYERSAWSSRCGTGMLASTVSGAASWRRTVRSCAARGMPAPARSPASRMRPGAETAALAGTLTSGGMFCQATLKDALTLEHPSRLAARNRHGRCPGPGCALRPMSGKWLDAGGPRRLDFVASTMELPLTLARTEVFPPKGDHNGQSRIESGGHHGRTR